MALRTRFAGIAGVAVIVFCVIAVRLEVARAAGPTITLEPFPTTFNNAVGIDFFEPSVAPGKLIVTANYPTGLPNNLDLLDAAGVHTPYSSLAGENDELKIATVRAGPCTGGFVVGTVFAGIGDEEVGDVAIAKIAPDGTIVNPWVTLTSEAHIRGSLYQDRACAFGGDLIVVTGNEQYEADPYVGSVWRVNAAGVATRIVSLRKHLEGVITLPDDPVKYGPLAGRIVAGDEDFNFPAPPNGPYGKVFGIKSANDVITVGAVDPQYPSFPNYPTSAPINPEDLDIIPYPRPNLANDGDFFAIDFGGRQMLRAPALDFADKCGDILVTQEFPNQNVSSGFSTLKWNGASFEVTPLINLGSAQPVQFEHVTFWGGTDCPKPNLVVEKVAKTDVIRAGETARFAITVKNLGPGVAEGVVLTDTLPPGRTWTHDRPGLCAITGGQLRCTIGMLAEGATFTVVLSAPTTPQDCLRLCNTATVSGSNEDPSKLDDNSASACITVECVSHGCTPGYWKNHATNPPWGGYTPSQSVESVFTIPTGIPSYLAFRNETLLDALQGGGGPGLDGKTRILLRAATAALLNADNGTPPYPVSEGEVISRTNAALATLDEAAITRLATAFDMWNNQCDIGSLPAHRPGDFDGDGRSEVGVFTPATGVWSLLASSNGYTVPQIVAWGHRGDLPVAADYDGDGWSDIAVYRPTTGEWFIIASSTGTSVTLAWGAEADLAVPADYDADGRADIAVYRPRTGVWYIVTSKTGQGVSIAWGAEGDIPVPGDYDGDRQTDIAVYRPATGHWFVIASSNGLGAVYGWGSVGDVPVPGDYDGDGRTDLAIYRPAAGTWHIVASSTGTGAVQGWGALGDIPVPADYDGDGRTDLAVYRLSAGDWYIALSASGSPNVLHWGDAGDLPIVAR